MDLNDPVQQYNHTQFFDELNMKEAILNIHSGSPPPSTTIRNESNTPIDGIRCSLGFTAQRGGYSKFKVGIPSDHRVLWVEFQLTAFFGSPGTIVKKVIQLKASDPRDIKKYITRSNKKLKKTQLPVDIKGFTFNPN